MVDVRIKIMEDGIPAIVLPMHIRIIPRHIRRSRASKRKSLEIQDLFLDPDDDEL